MSGRLAWRLDTRRWLVVAGLLLLAALLRLATMAYHEIRYDDATVALVATHVLRGEAFPVFFYRQAYMGSLNGVHLVPALFLFGPSALLVRLNAVAYGLLFPLLLYVLGRRLFDEATARVALLLAAVPPFLLTSWSTVAEPHFETNLFGVVLLLLAVAAIEAEPGGARSVRILVCFGLAAGLAWWTNFKALEIIAPALLVVWLRDPWLPLRRAGAALAGGFLLGSLPVWTFYAAREHGDAGARAIQLFQGGVAWSAERLWALVTIVLPTLLGTFYWPADTWLRRAALLANVAVYLVASAAMVAEILRLRRRGGTPEAREWGLWLLLLTLVTPFAMLYASSFARRFDHESARYVLVVYIPLLLFVAALVVRLERRSRMLGATLLACLVAFNLWTNARYLWPLDVAERARRAWIVAAREAVIRHLAAHPVEALYVDDQFASLVWAFHLGGLPVSEMTTELYLPNALAADAAGRVAILTRRDQAGVTEHLAMLGATYRTTRLPGHLLLDEIRVPAQASRLIPRDAWRIRGGPAGRAAVADGDLATAWPAEASLGREPADLVVDLGAPYPVSRVVWWPSTVWEETRPLVVAGSADGVQWDPMGTLTRRPAFVAGGRPFFRPRNGWLELRSESRRIRYLRFAPTEPAAEEVWGIAELYVYEDGGSGSSEDPDSRTLTALLRARGLTRLLADPAISARVAWATRGAIGTLPSNGFLDSHGRYLPPARLADGVRLRSTDGLLVPAEDAEDLRTRLAAAGVRFGEEPVEHHVLFHGLSPLVPPLPCRRTTWRLATTFTNEDDKGARYVVEARLQGAQRVVGVRVDHPALSARLVPPPTLEVSDDGRTWRRVDGIRRLDAWGWAGRTLFKSSGEAEELVLPVTPAGYVRVELRLPRVSEPAITNLCVRGERLP